MEAFERKTGERPEELDQCEIPKEAWHIWEWFLELHGTRTGSGFGWNPIQYSEILAWGKLTGNMPKGHEIGLIRRLDGVFMEVMAPKEAKKNGRSAAKSEQ